MSYTISNERRKQTLLNTYGVTNVSQIPEVQEKRRRTFESKRRTIVFYQEPRINIIEGKQLQLYRLDKDYTDSWLNNYHPLGTTRGNILNLGLADDNTLYCVMTFKKSRNKKYYVELSRMFMLPTYFVKDGYQILSEFASNLGIYNIVAYVNMSFENYKDYESIGMKYIRDIQRTKWWIKDDVKMSDDSRRQYKLNQESMLDEGWIPAYDCGQRVYVF